jgi:hypothetical protein
VGKVYNLCRVKTDIPAVLTVTSGLDPHMIIELEDDLSCCIFIDVVVYLISLLYKGWYKLKPS